MAEYIRNTVYNADGSIRHRTFTDSTSENSIFETDAMLTPEEPLDPLDPEIAFGRSYGRTIEKETYNIKSETDIWLILMNRLREYLFKFHRHN